MSQSKAEVLSSAGGGEVLPLAALLVTPLTDFLLTQFTKNIKGKTETHFGSCLLETQPTLSESGTANSLNPKGSPCSRTPTYPLLGLIWFVLQPVLHSITQERSLLCEYP